MVDFSPFPPMETHSVTSCLLSACQFPSELGPTLKEKILLPLGDLSFEMGLL